MANFGRGSNSGLLSHEEVSQRAWRLLAPTLGDDLRIIQREVLQGVAQLIQWAEEFYTVVRSEDSATGAELVIVAAAGKNSLLHLQQINALAKAQGFVSIRLHTVKPDAMLRLSDKGKLGYQRAETILRTVL